MNKTMFVNFYINKNDNTQFFMGKDVESSKLSEYILTSYGEIKIGRTLPKELDVMITVYSEEDENLISKEILLL